MVEALLWRMFCPDFKGEIEVVACADDEEGFNRTIRDNFRLPERDMPEAELPQGKGILIYSSFIVFRQLVFDDCFWVETHRRSGGPAAAGVPKQPVQQIGDQRFRKPKKPHEPVVVPPLVPKVAGISCTCLHQYDDYVVMSDTLEGLGVPGGVATTGGSSAGTKPVDDKKRKGDASVAGGQKAPKLRRTRGTAILKATPAVTTETQEEPVNLFATPPSSPKAADVEVQKEDRRSPSIEMVTPPSVHAEDTARKTAGETIVDTLHSSNNLIDPHDAEG
ncbi:hypothetical protein HanPI659440_Chr15g0601311 [Helianthus annuus]|nr:hypothetical protein HanPI659440_Chr15g0601311 [Helianthus annuus]